MNILPTMLEDTTQAEADHPTDNNISDSASKSPGDIAKADVGREKTTKNNTDAQDTEERVEFLCKSCGLHEMAHYFGKQPSFVYGIEFCEPTYVMKDPFQPPAPKWKSKSEYFIALGAHCVRCSNVVCRDNSCHFFYKNTYCMPCAKSVACEFPVDIQQKIKKQLAVQH